MSFEIALYCDVIHNSIIGQLFTVFQVDAAKIVIANGIGKKKNSVKKDFEIKVQNDTMVRDLPACLYSSSPLAVDDEVAVLYRLIAGSFRKSRYTHASDISQLFTVFESML